MSKVLVVPKPIVAQTQKISLVKTFNDTNYFSKGTYKYDFARLFSSGVLANMITKTILAPLQRWRITKQTQINYKLRASKYQSFGEFVKLVKKEQGTKSLWRGNGANCWISLWQVIGQIYLFDSIKTTFSEYAYELRENQILKVILQKLVAPTIASFSVLAMTHPIDTARVRLSMNHYRNPKTLYFHGVTSCWSILRMEQRSVRGIYRGYLIANLISLLHLNIYAAFRDLYSSVQTKQFEDIQNIVLSKEAIGSLIAILMLHPLDTIKKNLQLNNMSKPITYNNAREVFQQYRQTHGLKKLYQGLTVTLVRQVLYAPVFFLTLKVLENNPISF